MAQNHTIKIIAGNIATGELTLSDHGKTDVDPGDTVTWVIDNKSKVAVITSITDDPGFAGSTNVFNPDPSPIGGSTNWKGTVDPLVLRGSMEKYTICWIPESGQQPLCFDPKIQVNP